MTDRPKDTLHDHALRNACAKIEMLNEQLVRATERELALRTHVERLYNAIKWALGYTHFRAKDPGEGNYWWRKELREISGFEEPPQQTMRQKAGTA